MSRKIVFIGLLMLSLSLFMGACWTMAATFDVDMGKTSPPCGGSGSSDIGFVDCTSSTGGILVAAMTTISAGDTVRWTMRSTPHTTTSELAQTGGPAAACATGDNWDSGTANSFTPGFVFTHTFSTPGTCTYFCFIHPTTMFGQVNVTGGATTTTTVATTTTTVATTTTTRPTTTTTSGTTTTTVATTTTTVVTTTSTTTTTTLATTTTAATTTTTVATTTTTVATTTTTTIRGQTTTTVATTTTTAATTTTAIVATTTTTTSTTTRPTTVTTSTTTTSTVCQPRPGGGPCPSTTTTTLPGQTTTTTTTTVTTLATTTTTLPGQTTTTRATTTTTTVATTTTTLPGQTTTTLPGQTTTTTTTTVTTLATTTTTLPGQTTTTRATTTTTTVATTTTTAATTTTTIAGTRGDVGIKKIDAPHDVKTGKTYKVEVVVKNFSDATQTRSLSLTLDGTPVSGSPVSITLKKQQENHVKFEVLFGSEGTATLQATLSPADINPTNDMITTTVTIAGTEGDDVGIKKIDAPHDVKTSKTHKVEVVVKNFSDATQTRSLSLTLDGTSVSGSPVSITLKKQQENHVKFEVLFGSEGTATLQATLSPADINPANDMKTTTVKVKAD